MKYSIERFSQEQLIKHGLDCRDAIFLGWLIDFQAADRVKKHIEDQDVYYWLDHQKIIDELPILGRSTLASVGKYINQLVEKSVLDKHTIRRGTDKGTAVFYRVVPDLVYDCTTETDEEHYHNRTSATLAQSVGSDSSIMIPVPQELERGGDVVDKATREPESAQPPEPPPHDDKPPEKMTRVIFRENILDVLRKNNPAVQIPYETDYKAAEDAAREYGGRVYLEWLTEQSKKNPTKRLFFLHQDHLGTLWGARQAETERAETERQQAEREANRCPHGHLDPKVCRECFFEDNPRSENLFEDVPEALRKADTPKARADREREKLKAV